MARILIVDDEAHQRLLYRELLEDEGHLVLEAADGAMALEIVRRETPDLVILDINMPGPDGLQTLRRLHDLNPRLAVILNSAYAAYKDQFVSWLADAYVTKSSRTDDMIATVHAVLAQRGNNRVAQSGRPHA